MHGSRCHSKKQNLTHSVKFKSATIILLSFLDDSITSDKHNELEDLGNVEAALNKAELDAFSKHVLSKRKAFALLYFISD